MNIFIISKNNKLAQRMETLFADQAELVEWSKNGERFFKRNETIHFDILLIENAVHKNSESQLIRLLERVSSFNPSIQILLLVDADEVKTAMSALKAGAYQYTKLPVSDEELKLLILTALEDKPAFGIHQIDRGNTEIKGFDNLLGKSAPMQAVYRQIKRAAATDIPILILGETGTGKDLTAQAIHRHSNRRDSSYIPVNLGAIPSELVASELFGYEKGAFTGAIKQHKGKFEQSTNGTIFLDEIDSADEKVQVSLLRLIEEHKFQRIGGTKEIRSDARIIAASNSDIEELTSNSSFREDLFYRLDVFRIVMPALRDRVSDIPMLAEMFLTQFNKQFQKNIVDIEPEFIGILENYDWPGNVREMKNVIQRAVLVCDQKKLKIEHLPIRLRKEKRQAETLTFKIGTPLDSVERDMVLMALRMAGNNRTKAANLLGISRRAIYNKLRKHKID